jgi:hypothetical protein
MVWLFECVAVPTVRPDESRNTVLPPSMLALPVVRPALSRNVVRLPAVPVLAVPTVRPEASRRMVWPSGEAVAAV